MKSEHTVRDTARVYIQEKSRLTFYEDVAQQLMKLMNGSSLYGYLTTLCCNVYTDCMLLLLKLSLVDFFWSIFFCFVFIYNLILIMNVYMMFT